MRATTISPRRLDPEKTFLGTGWCFPPTFSRVDSAVVMVSGERDVHESLWILLSTSPGERIMVPGYGCPLDKMIFQSVDRTFATEIETEVRRSILLWEPRVEVLDVAVSTATGVDGLVYVRVDYLIRQTNTRSNLVYPFYLQEGTLPAQLP